MVATSIRNLDVVSETLLLPLYFRALESRNPSPILFDPMAEGLVARIPYDFSKLDNQEVVQVATMMRVREMDRMVAAFLSDHPEAVVVNVGAGLDTRFFRMDNTRLRWYELDLDPVTCIRKTFFEERENYGFLSASMFDPEWTQRICVEDRPVLVIAEGVLFYFEEEKVKRFIRLVGNRFPGAHLIFDTVSPFQVWMSHFNPAICTTQARFRWGLFLPGEMASWGPCFRLMDHHCYFDRPEPRLGWFNFFHLCPAVRLGFRVLHYRLGRPGGCADGAESTETGIVSGNMNGGSC